jgi:rhodanese-related sulfurtransferase
MHHQILPIPRKPYELNWLPERLIVSHYEKDYGAAVRSLNALRDRLAVMDPSAVAPAEMRALKREELSVMGSVMLHELYFVNLGGDGKIPAVAAAALENAFMQGEQQFQVVDARPRNYVSKDPDTMPNAVWRDPERVDEWCAQLSPEAPVFVYCAYGFEVGCRVTTTLRERGFDARYIRGGLAAWYGAGGARAVRSRE